MEEEKWIDAKVTVPKPFTLCVVKSKKRTLYGWFTGFGWDSGRDIECEEILYWKHRSKQYILD